MQRRKISLCHPCKIKKNEKKRIECHHRQIPSQHCEPAVPAMMRHFKLDELEAFFFFLFFFLDCHSEVVVAVQKPGSVFISHLRTSARVT